MLAVISLTDVSGNKKVQKVASIGCDWWIISLGFELQSLHDIVRCNNSNLITWYNLHPRKLYNVVFFNFREKVVIMSFITYTFVFS